MKKIKLWRIILIFVIASIIVLSSYWISKCFTPFRPANNNVTDTSPTLAKPSESVITEISSVESGISVTPFLSKQESELEMYVLQKVDANLYQYKDMFFQVDADGTLYMRNQSGEYTGLCKNDSANPHGTSESKYVSNDIYSKYEEIMNEYGDKKQYYFTGLNHYNYVCSYEDYDYFELVLMNGAGSGEYWGGENSGIYVGIHQSTMEIKEFGSFRAGYCKEKDNWVYYLDLINSDQERAKDFPVSRGYIIGMGQICRMRPDTGEKQVLSSDVAVDGFQIHNDKIYYVSFEDNKTKVISMDGKETYYTDNDFVFNNSFFQFPYTMHIFGNFILFEEFDHESDYTYIIIRDDLSAIRKIKESEYFNRWGVLCVDKHSILISLHHDMDILGDNILYLISDLDLSH